MTIFAKYAVALLIASGLSTAGCSSKPAEPAGQVAHEEHDHPTTGPHGGELIELGGEEYHAEILHENDVIVYLLDGSAKTAVAIEAPDVVLNLTHDGESEQFRLTATREATDPEGKASKFVSSDADLVADLKEGHAEVQLVVTVSGTQYRGALEHDHEEGHDH